MTDSKPATAWNDANLANPHEVVDKRQRVQKMFAAIAPSYDLNNRLHSVWQDQRWRKKAVKLAGLKDDEKVVDVACGTGDLAWAFAERLYNLWADAYLVSHKHAQTVISFRAAMSLVLISHTRCCHSPG